MSSESIYTHYVYSYLREDGTPYYIGKGKGPRAYRQHGHNVPVPPSERIAFIKKDISDCEAKQLEIELISKYGRKDLGTGILRNLTDGGDGMGGWVMRDTTKQKLRIANTGKRHTAETRQKMSKSAVGKKKPPRTEQHKANQRRSQGKELVIDGMVYYSSSHAQEVLGICRRTISNRVKNPNFPNYNYK